MNIAIAQMRSNPGDIKGNYERIVENIEIAKDKGAKIVVFPELTLPGYNSMDLFLEKGFIEENKKYIQKVADASQNILSVVGFVDTNGQIGPDNTPIRYNSAALVTNGNIIGVQDKTLLPTYDVFSEARYFAQSRGSKVFEYGGRKLGVQICEDLWDGNYPVKVTDELVSNGAEFIINLSASPFHTGKLNERQSLIEKMSKKHGVPFVYANLVGSYDGYDGQLVFDGRSMAFDLEGRLIAMGKDLEEDLILVDIGDSTRSSSLGFNHNKYDEIYNGLIMGIRDYFSLNGFEIAYLGISGGIDSALAAALAVDAIGEENVEGILMPSDNSSKDSVEDGIQLCENLGIKYSIKPIGDVFNSMVGIDESFARKPPFSIVEENIQARIRGMVLMAMSNKTPKSIVLSTGNKAETALGYTTAYGDMCGGLAVINDVDKLDVYELSKYINKSKKREVIPQKILDKKPSADLRPDQTDEEGLGAPYEVIVPIVNGIIEQRKTIEELSKEYPKEVVENCARLIEINEWKRRQAPPGIRVTNKAFGIGRRMPMTHGWQK